MDLVYTVNEVAELLKVTPQTIYELRNSGKLPAIKNIGRVLFNVNDVYSFIGIEDEFTPYNYRQLKLENKKLATEISIMFHELKKDVH